MDRCSGSIGFAAHEQLQGQLEKQDQHADHSQITSSAHFANDLGLDSLDTVEVVMAIEEEFSIEIPDKDADSIHSGTARPTPLI